MFDNDGIFQWFLAEYDPETKIAFVYEEGVFDGGWGNLSIEKMEGLGDVEISYNDNTKIPRIEICDCFEPAKF
jgi:hypothetical protein